MAPFQSSYSRYSAIAKRNPLADGHFVYAVLTTGIVCRPTCKARLARRSNIVFFSTYAAAVKAGFRACKRCKPELEGTRYEPREQSIKEACRVILERELRGDGNGKEGSGGSVKLVELAAHAGLTKSHFHRVFKRIVGVTPREFSNVVSAATSKGRVDNKSTWSPAPIFTLPSLSTFNAPSALSTQFAPSANSHACAGFADSSTSAPSTSTSVIAVGATYDNANIFHTGLLNTLIPQGIPTAVKKITYTVQEFHSGFVILAATSQGICFLEAGDCVPELVHNLWLQFRGAELESSGWVWRQEGGKGYNRMDEIDEMFEIVMQALTYPTGSIVNVPLDLYH
jgi:methylphosphotriester-DNA--protein-cysteine methyltransferase